MLQISGKRSKPNDIVSGSIEGYHKGILFIAVSQFGIAFSFNCIMSFMSFYILKVSPYSDKETMMWIGMIMGATPMIAAAAAPFWESLSPRIRPKMLFQSGIFGTAVIFLIVGFTGSLPLLLGLRLIQGGFGGVSTTGLVLISVLAPRDKLPNYLSLFQISITAGQVIGPPGGLRRDLLRLSLSFRYCLNCYFIYCVLPQVCHRYASAGKGPSGKKSA
jgi:MFS transporter, DHA1 family, multidrug resistance protein